MTEVSEDLADEVTRLKVELATAKAETQRIREQFSLDLAEAKVEAARIGRELHDTVRRLREAEAIQSQLAVQLVAYDDFRDRTIDILKRVIAGMEKDKTSEAQGF